MKKLFASFVLIFTVVASLSATDYLHNTVGIVRFKPRTSEIVDVSAVGRLTQIDYLGTGIYRLTISDSLPDAVYQVECSVIPGYVCGVISQNESYIDLGVTDLSGTPADTGEMSTASIHTLTILE